MTDPILGLSLFLSYDIKWMRYRSYKVRLFGKFAAKMTCACSEVVLLMYTLLV